MGMFEKMEEYHKRFNEGFPFELFSDEDYMIQLMDDCIKKGKPYRDKILDDPNVLI